MYWHVYSKSSQSFNYGKGFDFLPTVDPRPLWLKLKFRLKFRSNLFKILFMSELISKLATTEEIKRYLSAEIFMHFISALALSNRQFDEEK